ncbi:ninjurin-1-like isoform X1 [Aphis gossypii]|uniref:ninjurin-1-like isoform X1 n=1 Tax=Aphis gossypii TaxID=80765 RepID=UPI00100DEBE4|nr:ninjurin-1-like isoform X1 [Aphis gossypii]XP_050058496.1 ninjurin-1-like isoform X1 [Aphis gossypii]
MVITSDVSPAVDLKEQQQLAKPLDVNRYATKKTIAQGMLDIALLTANANQLKYILQVGEKHEFYKPLLVLIATSIFLQVFMGMIFLSLNLLRDCRFHLIEYKTSSLFINQVPVVCTFMVFTINIIIGAFDSGLASIVPTSTFNAPAVPPINSN